MAINRNQPRGLVPVRVEAGTQPKIGTYVVASGITLYQGSPCMINASGLVTSYTNTGALVGAVIGAAAGYATAGQECKVYDDPNQLFELQADDASITNLAGYRGALFRMATPTTGNATTLQSKCQLDASTAAAVTGSGAATVQPLRVENIVKRIGNVINSSYTKYEVRFIPAVHHYGMGAIGVLTTRFRGI